MKDFETRDIVRILDLNPRTLIDWAEIGLVVPAVRGAEGAGTRRRYSEHNLFELAIIKALLGDGIKREIVKAISVCFAKMPLTTEFLHLVIDLSARRAHWHFNANGLPLVGPPDKPYLVKDRLYILNVKPLIADVRARMGS